MSAQHPIGHEQGPPPGQRRPAQAGSAALLRLRVAVHRPTLDAQLAAGADTSDRPDLSLRAAQLESRARRRVLARTLRRLVVSASEPPPPVRASPVILARRQIRSQRETLIALADRLDSPQPADPAGVAIAQLLVSDGAGSPMYVPSEPGLLGRVARQAIACMDAPEHPPVRWPPPRTRAREHSERCAITTVLLRETPDADRVVARRVRRRDRMRARLRATPLDRALAAGVCPDADVTLSLRAHRLIGLDARRTLADAARAFAGETADGLDELLRQLATRLLAPEPVDPCAVARTRLLLADLSGCCHDPALADLGPSLRALIDDLNASG